MSLTWVVPAAGRIGTGASTRLSDPTGYTDQRSLEDLEAVRARTRAPRVVLHGHSWGARIAVAYAQQHRTGSPH